MADAWGGAWGSSWGVSWGYSPSGPSANRDDAPVRQRRRLRPEEIIAIVEAVRAAEETKPEPTTKKRKVLARKIVEAVWEDTLFAPARKPVEQFVRQEVSQFYKSGVSWAEVHAAVTRLIEMAQAEARRIEQEIEDEDEMILLMVA